MSDESGNTHAKALKINLDALKYGTFAEIGAGQEVVRWFFHAGKAASTIAKTVSAYDMAREGTYLAECRLLVEQIPVMIDCPRCEVRRSVVSVHQICCAVCGAVAPEIASGRELEVAALEIDS